MKAQEFLNNRADHHIRFLFKFSLAMLEDLKNTHEINFNKLKIEEIVAVLASNIDNKIKHVQSHNSFS